MMKNSLRLIRRPRPATARTGAAIIATVTLAVLAAACSSSSSSSGSGGSPHAGGAASAHSAVGYSHCIRSHGVPRYPDPSGDGVLPKTSAQQLGVSSSALQAAQSACQHLLPSDGGTLNADSFRQCMLAGDCPQALVRQAMTEMLRFSRCMRAHGVPNWPDPTIGTQGRPYFDLSGHGFSRQQARSPQLTRKSSECGYEMPGVGGIPVG
jgi:hypothetical protein